MRNHWFFGVGWVLASRKAERESEKGFSGFLWF
jgi:hypothetical protein